MKNLILAFLFLSSPTFAATYYVAKTGGGTTCGIASPCLTIAIGASKLAAGDTLEIAAGTYAEFVGFTSVPSGTAGSPTIVKNKAGDTVIINGATQGLIISAYDRSYITYDGLIAEGLVGGVRTHNIGFWVGGTNASPGAGLTHHITFQNGEIRNVLAPGTGAITGGPNAGHHHITIKNIIVHDSGQVSDSTGTGIYANGSDWIVDGCTVYNMIRVGIQVYNSGNATIDRAIIRNNRVRNNGSIGISLGSSSGGSHQAYNNLIYGNGTGFVGAGGARLFSNCPSCKFFNNTIWNNTGYALEISPPGTITSSEARNNILYQNTVSNTVNSSFPIKSNNLEGTDPKFVNTTDFELGAGSPAIGAAVDLSTTIGNTDFDGTVRTGAWDAGAQEVSAATESITLLTPNGGSLPTGSTQSISWGSSGITNVRLRYSPNGLAFTSPVVVPGGSSVLATLQTFPFTAPATGTTYRFEVCDAADNTPCDYSDSNVVITAAAGGTFTKIISENTNADIPGMDDTYIYSVVPTTNFGSSGAIFTQPDANTLLRPSGLSQIPPTAIITSMSLSVWRENGGASPVTIAVRRLLRPLNENAATWNTYDGINNWTTPGALGDGTDRVATASASFTSVGPTNGQYYTVTDSSGTLLDDIQKRVNGTYADLAWQLSTSGNFNKFSSSEGIDGQRPKLSVTFTVTTPTITLAQPSAGEILYPGDTMAIRWQSSDFSGNVISTLSLNNGLSYDNIIVASHPFDQPDATWVVTLSPTISASTQAKVKVCSITNPTVCSESPAFNLAGNRR